MVVEMKTIFKYPLTLSEQGIEMPEGAQILTVQVQNNTPYLWALVSPSSPTELKRITVLGTGHSIIEDKFLAYIGTFQLDCGELVFHVFEHLHKG